jgi:hypothetical protein
VLVACLFGKPGTQIKFLKIVTWFGPSQHISSLPTSFRQPKGEVCVAKKASPHGVFMQNFPAAYKYNPKVMMLTFSTLLPNLDSRVISFSGSSSVTTTKTFRHSST